MPKKRRKQTIKNYPPFAKASEDKRIKNENREEESQNQISYKLADSQGNKIKKLKVKNITATPVESFAPANQPLAQESEFDSGKEEQKNKLIMWLGIGGVMIVFFVAWIFNLKYEFKASLKKSATSGFNWSQTKSELDKAMTQVKQGLAEVKKIQANLKANALPSETKLTAEQINLLKGKLLNEAATGTASSTVKNWK